MSVVIGRSLELTLNGIIDSEFLKTKIDCDLLCEATDGLLRIENTDKYIISSDEMNRRIRELRKRNLSGRRVIRILIAAAILSVLLMIAVVAHTVVKYDIKTFSDFSTVVVELFGDKTVKDLTVGYMPVGFELKEKSVETYGIIYIYANEKSGEYISISKSRPGNISINTEFEGAEILTVNGVDYICFGENEHGRGVLWFDGYYEYDIVSLLPWEELLKIAQNID